MMKYVPLSCILCFLCMMMGLQTIHAQTQQGYVRVIGRPDKPGRLLPNVVIRMRGVVNTVLSDSEGHFSVSFPDKKDGDPIFLLSAQRNGYELKDPGLIGRPQTFSSRVPIEILMVDSKQLVADRKRISENAERVAERNYKQKLQELERQKQDSEISAEQYRQELQSLQDRYEKYLSLVDDLADRYARTDYDQLDSIDREINICIENGELDKADSLIHSVFDPETVLERNRAAKEEIRQRIAFAQSVIDKACADREAIKRDIEYAKDLAILCKNLANEYSAQGERDKAIGCLEKALGIEAVLYGEESEEVMVIRQQINTLQQ